MNRRILALGATLGVAVLLVVALMLYRRDNPTTQAGWLRQSDRIIAAYMAETEVKKLQIGAGEAAMDGWLNTDLVYREGLAFMDATEPFPFDDGTFRYVFSEHVIEHIPYDKGVFMMKETYRVLEPGGKVRVATPDLQVYLDLFDEPLTPEQQAYIDGKLAWHHWKPGPHAPTTILNLQLRSWGHQFVYDAATLEAVLRDAGFTDIKRYPAGMSDDPVLRGVEARKDRDIAALNDFETMIFEATR